MKKKIGLLLAMVLVLMTLSACDNQESQGQPLRIIDARISEGKLLIAMVEKLIEANTDVEVEVLDEMSPVNSYNELQRGNADVFNSYDGTVLTTFLHYDVEDVTKGSTIYDFANEKLAEEGLEMLDKLGNNNTYSIGVIQEVVDQYDPKIISDLQEIGPNLIFGAEHDFFTEEGNIKYGPFSEAYDLEFKDFYRMDLGLKYAAVESGQMDVTVVYTTDGLNIKAGLTVLEDDLGFFPDYYGALVVRSDIFDTYGEDLRDAMNLLAGRLPNEKMVELTYAVDVEMKDIDQVAQEFLEAEGLL